MSDEPKTATPKKPRGGWPKGKPRASKPAAMSDADILEAATRIKEAADRAEQRIKSGGKWKLKSRPNWESDDFAGVGLEGSDRLNIPQDVVDALHRDGYALQWATRQVRGRDEPQELAKFTRGGWTPVHQSDFGGLLDGMFMPKGRDEAICVEDCILVTRPTEINAKAKLSEMRKARHPMHVVEEQIGTRGIPNVTGADHPTARRGNMINKSVERIDVPE